MGSINEGYVACKTSFESLIESLESPKRPFGDQIPAKEVINEYERFKVWSGSVGAGHPPIRRISLDYRLRDSEFYRSTIIEILSQLERTITKATQLLQKERLPFEEEDEIESLSSSESESQSTGISDDGLGPHVPPSSDDIPGVFADQRSMTTTDNGGLTSVEKREMPQLYKYMQELIQNLYSMSMIIRRPIALDRLSRATKVPVEHFQEFDQKYVDDCFRNATPILKARMAKAITRRRQLLRYNEQHSQKLSGSQVQATIAPSAAEDEKPKQQQEVDHQIRDFPSPMEAVSHSAPSLVERSLFASTAASKFVPPTAEAETHPDAQSEEGTISSFNFSQGGGEIIRLPQRPLDSDRNERDEFPCPLCFHPVRIRTSKAWAINSKHVFKDLQAYVCTFDNCKEPDQMFETRNDWIHHEFLYHRREWACSTPGHVAYRDKSEFIGHVQRSHSPDATDDQLLSLSQLCERPISTGEVSCPLCTENPACIDAGLKSLQLCESVRRACENVPNRNSDDSMAREPEGRFNETSELEDFTTIETWILSTPDNYGTANPEENEFSPKSSPANSTSPKLTPYKLDPKRVKYHIAQHLERSALFAINPSRNTDDDENSFRTNYASCVPRSSYLSFDSSLSTPTTSSAQVADEPGDYQSPSPSMPRATSGQTTRQSSQHELSLSPSRTNSESRTTSGQITRQSSQHELSPSPSRTNSEPRTTSGQITRQSSQHELSPSPSRATSEPRPISSQASRQSSQRELSPSPSRATSEPRPISSQASRQSSQRELSPFPSRTTSEPRTTSSQAARQSSEHEPSSSPSRTDSMSLFQLLAESLKKDDLSSRNFMPLSDLDDLINGENVKSELRSTQKNRLLALFQSDKPGKLASRVMKDGKKLFTILMHVNLPWGVKNLLDAGFTDKDLPFSMDKEYLVSVAQPAKRFKWPEAWHLPTLHIFVDKQWVTMAPIFINGGNCGELSTHQPLPFLTAKPQYDTQCNTLYKAKIHQSHQRGFEDETPNLQVALKMFRWPDNYRREINVLNKIRNLPKTKHITQRLDTFRVDNVHYIIYPWAEGGDLYNFWKIRDSEGRARSPELALWCLEQMLGLSEALEALHYGMGDRSNCRHGDLKPKNILHFPSRIEGSLGTLKMTDFDQSRIHNLDTIQRQGVDTMAKAVSPVYRAPEDGYEEARSRKYDIWSLGCVFLEFTLWVLRDRQALKAFDAARLRKRPGSTNMGEFYMSAEGGAEVHPAVLEVIIDLGSLHRGRTDTAFGDLLYVIESGLLQVQVKKRMSATMLCHRLGAIVKRARKDGAYLSFHQS